MYISDKYCLGTSIDNEINITNGKNPLFTLEYCKLLAQSNLGVIRHLSDYHTCFHDQSSRFAGKSKRARHNKT